MIAKDLLPRAVPILRSCGASLRRDAIRRRWAARRGQHLNEPGSRRRRLGAELGASRSGSAASTAGGVGPVQVPRRHSSLGVKSSMTTERRPQPLSRAGRRIRALPWPPPSSVSSATARRPQVRPSPCRTVTGNLGEHASRRIRQQPVVLHADSRTPVLARWPARPGPPAAGARLADHAVGDPARQQLQQAAVRGPAGKSEPGLPRRRHGSLDQRRQVAEAAVGIGPFMDPAHSSPTGQADPSRVAFRSCATLAV